MTEPVLSKLEQRLGGRVYARQRLKIETDREAQVFGQGLFNFFHIILPQFSCCQSSPFNSLLVGTPCAAVVWAVWGSLPTAAAPRLW